MTNKLLNKFREHLCGVGVSTPTFTLVSEFKRFLIQQCSLDRLKADDLAIKFLSRLEDVFDDVQVYFESAGVDCPYYRNAELSCFHSFNHSKFRTDIKWDEFKAIEAFILNSEPTELLLISGLALITDGNFMIVVNDGPNDGGVDLIAKNKDSDFNCQIVLAQVKKSVKSVSKEVVIYEHANYWDQIIRKDKLPEYYEMINVNKKSMALEVVYHFFTNNELSASAISYAQARAIKIRYAREVAACLSKKYTAKEIIKWVQVGVVENKYKRGTILCGDYS